MTDTQLIFDLFALTRHPTVAETVAQPEAAYFSPWLLSLWLALTAVAYAEIHYRVKGIPSYLYKAEPEIVFDLPYRGQAGQPIPLFLFIKDADRFPATLERLKISIAASPAAVTHLESELEQRIEAKFFSWTFQVPARHFSQPGNYRVLAELSYRVNNRPRRLRQDNYRSIPRKAFSINISADPLPALPGWHWGDLHLHSNFTDDQVEFGAPVRETALCARAVGLSFIAVTDHSYDLDDAPGNYLANDPNLPKWHQLLEECERCTGLFPGFVALAGEEVSAGNERGQNVHCLVLGNRAFYPGSGDGGEKLFENRPTLFLEELFRRVQNAAEGAIIAAAHPFDKPPLSQQWVLNRGYWRREDLYREGLDYWQILNGLRNDSFEQGLQAWIEALLAGRRIGILAGTDAHGNFNCFRQVSIPFFKMARRRRQLLGETRTGIYSEKPLTRAALLEALKQKRAIISDGPAAELSVYQEGRLYRIGDTARANLPATVRIAAQSSREFGGLTSMLLCLGERGQKEEREMLIPLPGEAYRHQTEVEFPAGLPRGYARLAVHAGERLCLTNPVWVE